MNNFIQSLINLIMPYFQSDRIKIFNGPFKIKCIAIALTLCLPIELRAREDTDYRKSQQCAGALSIMTALGIQDETTPIYKYFDDLLMFHSYLLEYYSSRDPSGTTLATVTSNGVIFVDDAVISDSSSLANTVKHCISWLHAVQGYFGQQARNTPINQLLAGSPKPSKTYPYPFEHWLPMVSVVESAHQTWQSSGLRQYHQCMAKGDGKASSQMLCAYEIKR